jgi:hypothetical protein
VIQVSDFSSDSGEEERTFDQRECHGGRARDGVFGPAVVAEVAFEQGLPLLEAACRRGSKAGSDDG